MFQLNTSLEQSFDAKPPTCVENVNVLSAVKLRERLHSTQVSTQVSTVMTRHHAQHLTLDQFLNQI